MTATAGKAASTNPKAAKLRELASARVPKAIRALHLIANLSGYKPTEAQKTAIVSALENAMKDLKQRFAGSVPEEPQFKLPE